MCLRDVILGCRPEPFTKHLCQICIHKVSQLRCPLSRRSETSLAAVRLAPLIPERVAPVLRNRLAPIVRGDLLATGRKRAVYIRHSRGVVRGPAHVKHGVVSVRVHDL